MSHFHSNMLLGASGNQGYEIARSLRFNDDDSAYLDFTPDPAGNQKTWTWSAWIKRSASLGSYQHLFNPVNGGDGVNESSLRFDNSDRFQVLDSGNLRGDLVTTQVFRDVSAWYHIVVALDTTQATPSNRLKIYVNGQQVTDFDTETYPTQDTTWGWNANQRHDLGRYAYGSSLYFDGYMAEVHFVDGTQLAASNFGETDSDTGAWIPKKYSGSYGSQGWYLKFADNSDITATTLGKDSSGNGNNWTPNAFSVSAGTGNDSLEDTPTNNHATFNSIDHQEGSSTFSQGNLKVVTTSSGTGRAISTIRPTSGKWYCEFTVDDATRFSVGVENGDRESSAQGGNSTNSVIVFYNRSAYFNGSATSNYLDANISNGNTIQVALDLDNNAVYVGRNNTWGNSATASEIASGTTTNSLSAFVGSTNMLTGDVGVFVEDNSGSGTMGATANFGQRAFTYTPPTGFKALNTANLPVPTIKDGTKYMQTVLYTGNLTARNITVADSQDNSWQPDWVWIKGRPTTSSHTLYDSVRGATKVLFSHNNNSESTDADTLTQFRSDGFSLGVDVKVNTNSDTYASWNWKAGGNSNTFNVDGTGYATAAAAGLDGGTLTPTGASVNTTSGFSVIAYTGDGNDPGSSTVTCSHGLGKSPAMIITKKRSSGGTDYNWSTWHKELGSGYGIWLNLNNQRNPAMWDGDSNHSSTLFSPADKDYNNVLSQTYINYVFAEVDGFSKFGSYLGNGLTDGPFIHCGFSVAYLMVKKYTDTENWAIYDNKRNPFNPLDKEIFADSGLGEYDGNRYIDFLSNGFKLKANSGTGNLSGESYIFMAFGGNPFKYANAR